MYFATLFRARRLSLTRHAAFAFGVGWAVPSIIREDQELETTCAFIVWASRIPGPIGPPSYILPAWASTPMTSGWTVRSGGEAHGSQGCQVKSDVSLVQLPLT